MPIKVTTESFIIKAIEVHGDRYDYSQTVYKNSKEKIKIICQEHGVFEQNHLSHLAGSGCPKCALEKKQQQGKDRVAKAKSEFVSKANLVHNNNYDYSLVNYTGNKDKVTIICREHGPFNMQPNNHLSGQQCPACSGNTRYTTETFITKAKTIHEEKFDYSKVDYKGIFTKIEIICREHRSFLMTPDNHINTGKQGCPICANIIRSENTGWSRTSFVEKCEKNNNGLGILYILECFNENERFFKIGITSLGVKKRYASSRDLPYAYSVIKEIVGDGAYIYDLEKELHREHKASKYTPELFFKGNTECFSTLVTKGSSLSF